MTNGSLFTIARLVLRLGKGGDGLQMWRVVANALSKKSRTADRRWSSILDVGQGANNF
jgi:hypothetical protein